MVVHYPRTVWKNSYAAEHEVAGKTYNLKKRNSKGNSHVLEIVEKGAFLAEKAMIS